MKDDLFLKNFLKLTIKFYSGETQLKVARRSRKKIISMALPPGIELVFAAGAAPIFLCRIGDYSGSPFLRAARLYQGIFGWNLLSSGIRFLRPLTGNQAGHALGEHDPIELELDWPGASVRWVVLRATPGSRRVASVL